MTASQDKTTERTRWHIQVAEMSCLRRVAWLSLRDRVRNSDIRKEFGAEPLLFCVKRMDGSIKGHSGHGQDACAYDWKQYVSLCTATQKHSSENKCETLKSFL